MTLAMPERQLDVGAAIERLWEAPSPAGTTLLRGGGMPSPLADRYGGELLMPLRADRPVVVANFVSTLDGVVALGGGRLTGGGLISGFHEPDRFVMSLLRALADVVVVGAGTVRGSTSQRWIPEHLQPRFAAELAGWRASMGLAHTPTTVVVSGRGDIPVRHPGLVDGSIPVVIATTAFGAERLQTAGLAPHVRVRPVADGATLTGRDVVALTERLGARLVLSEGGPHLLGELVRHDLLDELFLTLAPQLVGRDGTERIGLVEGVALEAAAARWLEPASVRRSGRHLFLRYRRAGHPSETEES